MARKTLEICVALAILGAFMPAIRYLYQELDTLELVRQLLDLLF